MSVETTAVGRGSSKVAVQLYNIRGFVNLLESGTFDFIGEEKITYKHVNLANIKPGAWMCVSCWKIIDTEPGDEQKNRFEHYSTEVIEKD